LERYLYRLASPVADDAATGAPPSILTAPLRLLPLRSLGAHHPPSCRTGTWPADERRAQITPSCIS